ncbi:hypothetical protein KXD40_004066 [Peronospora effusa]|uniref:Uncharacterized protein n=1 Tax=Peronospora effusa TaxID=542832 RepID=A0A3M6V796_9STRA|nr:hypothetical protein DD238_007285 [Peronospora effusa]RQM14210.1 hypothetical protein DD237_007761 [Peronospora effusa]UIZ23123.1 hypothetical protein KXD40_004066 [Peronospora effusa]
MDLIYNLFGRKSHDMKRQLRQSLKFAARSTAQPTRRWINYGHDMHKEMLNGTAKVSVTEYDEGGFVVNDVNMRGGVALFSEVAMLWKPKRIEEITREHLAVFTVFSPPIGKLRNFVVI